MSKYNMLKELVNVYWLRPETALWRAVDIYIMNDFEYKGYSLDLGCGDGVFSFIRAGGSFKNEFDDYRSVGNLDKYYENSDIHDIYFQEYTPLIDLDPQYRISVGLDHKKNLINKAKQLRLYDKYVIHDANKTFPFKDNEFDSIFSNILYWLNDPQIVLADLTRILKKGGQLAVMLPDSVFAEQSYYNQLYLKKGDDRYDFLKYMDRGRYSSNIKVSKSYSDWEKIIKDSGLVIRDHKMHLSKTLIKIWDIGLRPLFPVLLKLVNSVNDKDLFLEIKKDWMEIILKFLEPIYDLELSNNNDGMSEKTFHYFLLTK